MTFLLPDTKHDARAKTQKILFVAGVVGEPGAKVVGLDDANGEVLFHGNVEAAVCQDGERVCGAGYSSI